jgi:YD repeat-containing protein
LATPSYTPPGNGSYSSSFDADRGLIGAALPSGRQQSFGYDAGGRLLNATEPESTTALAYPDVTGRPGTLTRTPTAGSPAESLAFAYSGDGP